MRTTPTPSEQFAFRLVGSVLGVAVDPTGEQQFAGHVDGILTYSSGRRAALEVTTLGDERVFEQLALRQRGKLAGTIAGSRLWWEVTIGPKVRVRDLFKVLDEAIRLHEQHGVTTPGYFFPPGVVQNSAALQWCRDHEIDVAGYDSTTEDERYSRRHAGAVRVMPKGWSGVVGDADEVPTWLSAQAMVNGQIKGKIDKLARSDLEEQHLFLIVDPSAEPFTFAWIVGDDEEIPTEDPRLGGGESCLARTGWLWEHLSDLGRARRVWQRRPFAS